MFISIDRRTLILKNGGMWSFSYETKALIQLCQWREWFCGANHEKKRDYYMNLFLSQLKDEL